MPMPYVWRGIDGQHIDAAAGLALDWDTAWSDAVHSHQSAAEGGTLDGAAITTTITGTGNVVKATAPTVTTLTVSSGGVAATGNSSVTGTLDVSGTLTAGSASANEFTLTGAASGSGPTLAVVGSDADADLNLSPKGPNGSVRVNTQHLYAQHGAGFVDFIARNFGGAVDSKTWAWRNAFGGTFLGVVFSDNETSTTTWLQAVRSGMTVTTLALTTGTSITLTSPSTVVSGTLSLSTAAARIVPGATSLSLRNTANSADNLLISDAGVATVRAGLTVTAGGATITAGGLTVSAGTAALQAVTGTTLSLSGTLTLTAAASKIVPGATSLALRNTADTADNLLISDAGDVTVRTRLLLASVVSKVIPGTSGIIFRNNADSTDNLSIADSGAAVFRSSVTLAGAADLIILGGGFMGAEIAEPAAPAANNGIAYFRDNGAGKTQLVVRFPTGAVQVIATEP